MAKSTATKTASTKTTTKAAAKTKKVVSDSSKANLDNHIKLQQFTHKELIEKVHENFGFEGFKGLQLKAIEHLSDGKDTFVIMPTGGGKSLCYQSY